MKVKNKIRVCLLFLASLCCTQRSEAQTLVLHHADGTTTEIQLTRHFLMTTTEDSVFIVNQGVRQAFKRSEVFSFSYKQLTGDVNGDGEVGIGDIVSVTNIMAGIGESDDVAYLTCPDANHPHLIDMGLPSGTQWACCNVGASAPEGYGNYYAWGETSPKSVYKWDTYQYGYYNYDGDYSHLVNIGSDIAGTSYDAATANWGSPWRMPSLSQIQELLNNCTSTWTTQNGVNGRKFVGPNGGTIFLPAAGSRWDGELYDAGSYGDFWSSTLDESNPDHAYLLDFDSGYADWSGNGRYGGQSVRPVR